jgi:hypothetical protein
MREQTERTSWSPETHRRVDRELRKYIIGPRILARSEACNFLWLHIHILIFKIKIIFRVKVKFQALLGLYCIVEQLAFLEFIVGRWGRVRRFYRWKHMESIGTWRKNRRRIWTGKHCVLEQ